MGRETKILLSMLGLLAGVFMGVVSMKLFVPRPPEGAGPDVHGDLADLETQPLVEPPDLDRPPSRNTDPDASEPDASEPYASRSSRFSQPLAGDEPEPPVQPASFLAAEPLGEIPLTDLPADLLPPASDAVSPPSTVPPPDVPASLPAAAELEPPPFGSTRLAAPGNREPLPAAELAATPLPPPGHPPATPPPRGLAADGASPPAVMTNAGYVARPGDSWWSLAERAYGDGRFYRALFAWNRSLDPRVSLQPGTRLGIPSPDRLAAAWPTLMPRD